MAPLIFDGHNDALSRLWGAGDDPVPAFARDEGQVNALACARGGMRGGFFAIFAPFRRAPTDFTAFDPLDFQKPLPPALDESRALVAAMGQAGIARRLHEVGLISIVTDAESLGTAWNGDALACVLHLEGADCIGEDLLALDALHALGLRSLGIVWSRPTIFGEGVPFVFGRDGDTGDGLTPAGRQLVARCRELGVMVDVSHLTMTGFWNVAEMGVPLVATHSNACSICLTSRNLTDAQLQAIGETGGLVGLNFGTVFLDEAAWTTGRAGLEPAIRHLAHMVEMAGEAHVGLGSDFDGAPMPDGIRSAADLPRLVRAMEAAGFGDRLIGRICHGNWLDFLNRHFTASVPVTDAIPT